MNYQSGTISPLRVGYEFVPFPLHSIESEEPEVIWLTQFVNQGHDHVAQKVSNYLDGMDKSFYGFVNILSGVYKPAGMLRIAKPYLGLHNWIVLWPKNAPFLDWRHELEGRDSRCVFLTPPMFANPSSFARSRCELFIYSLGGTLFAPPFYGRYLARDVYRWDLPLCCELWQNAMVVFQEDDGDVWIFDEHLGMGIFSMHENIVRTVASNFDEGLHALIDHLWPGRKKDPNLQSRSELR